MDITIQFLDKNNCQKFGFYGSKLKFFVLILVFHVKIYQNCRSTGQHLSKFESSGQKIIAQWIILKLIT